MGNFEKALKKRDIPGNRKIGAELKFPMVNADATAVSPEKTSALWNFLQKKGWTPVIDSASGEITGCKKKGEENYTVASCETGFCKAEFSLAYVPDLFSLRDIYLSLKETLMEFSEKEKAYFMGYGIHPVSKPGGHLLMKQKSRTGVWDRVFGANRILREEEGGDLALFTVNAASHVHIDASMEEIVDAVNILNGFSGSQIALTAHSNVWKGKLDPQFKCVNEKFWDWWIPDAGRSGVPKKPFKDLEDYVRTVSAFKPVYTKRGGKPLLLSEYESFSDYYAMDRATAIGLDGKKVEVKPEEGDIDIHNTCYWYNSRITRYCTVENRANDQQPPEDVLSIAAMTLGLVSALPEAVKVTEKYPWSVLRKARKTACEQGLDGSVEGFSLHDMAQEMVETARHGLLKRGRGEEVFVEPLEKRIKDKKCPADETREFFLKGGTEELFLRRKI